MTSEADLTLTTRRAAALLGVSLRTVQLWVESGVLEAWKTSGGHRRVSVNSINKVMAKRDLIAQHKMSLRTSELALQVQPASLNIIIAEDNPVYRELLEFYFKNLKVAVDLTMVSDGFECLICIGRKLPDVVIVDLNMPNLNGFECIRYLKSNEAYSNIQLIALTGLTQQDIELKGGLPEDVLVCFKPFSFKELELVINDLILKKQALI